MRLFGYYAWHSFVNQLRKLFKTWVLIFLVICMAIGGLIGVGAAMLEDAAGEDEEIVDSEVIEEEEPDIQLQLDIEPMELVELIVGGVILAVFAFGAISADKNGSRIFLPADVNLLFASPMKPQSVLLFRLMTQLGTSILASVYLLFQLPNLVLNLGLSIWVALAMIAVWCLTIVMSKLVQILLYTVCSTHVKLKKHLRNGIYAFLLVLAGAYLMYWKASGDSYLGAAAGFFNGSVSRFIPLWGWLKGFCMFAIEGNIAGLLMSLAAIVVGGILLTYIIWHVKADFYEDAMAKSEETAELLAAAQSEKAGVTVIRRKKDRSDKLRRDGMGQGSGANVFFHKAMYNRFRFAHFGIFTKTSETYLFAAVAVSVLCRFVIQAEGLIPVMLTLGVLTFFRAMGNPLEQDTQMDHFLLIPESTWHKLFWSLMGGTANCFLDLLPAVIVAALLLGENMLIALAWIPLIVSVDFFATTVGAFIGLSVPVSAGKTVKQLVQILFIYFGLLPDIAIMAIGLVFEQPVLAAIGCVVVNILLGLVFFFLTPLFLEPKDGKKYAPEKTFAGNLNEAKKHFSRLGLGSFVILGLGSVVQILAMGVIDGVFPRWMENSWGMWLITFVPLYLIAVPVGLLLLRKVPVKPLEKHDLKPGRYIVSAIICIFMMYAGNILGTVITALLQLLPGISAGNPILGYATDDALLPKVLFMVILAPVIEEYIFRKQLIDRMHIYGEKLAVITSALMFGLFHGNLSQLFYAFALGLVFGYVYLKTGKLRYSIGLHMLINFIGSVVGPFFLEKLAVLDTMETMDLAALEPILPWLLGFGAYVLVLVGLAITGLVLLCINKRRVSFDPADLELPKESRFKTVYMNAGMILLVIGCMALIIANVI
ncbi:MAG: CPBP family intramembrane metalloprotease [Oscillospiraceae bacterium]|nr:CPBP family intramembrane metalloprotease [Oscillospiraceae bacterium]